MNIPLRYISREARTGGEYIRPRATWALGGEKKGWLSEIDIKNAMAQIEKENRDFVFLGTENIDFWYKRPQKWYHGKTFDDYIAEGERKFALILFLSGDYLTYKRHWTCIYIDTDACTIDYFDSSLFKVLRPVMHVIIKMIIPLIIRAGKRYTFSRNIEQTQFANGECGIFVIDFIKSRLSGETMNSYISREHNIDKLRDIYFKGTSS